MLQHSLVKSHNYAMCTPELYTMHTNTVVIRHSLVSLSAGLFFGILLRPVLLAKESFTRGILISNCSYKNEHIIHTFLSVFIITIPIPFLVLQHLVAWVELLYVDALWQHIKGVQWQYPLLYVNKMSLFGLVITSRVRVIALFLCQFVSHFVDTKMSKLGTLAAFSCNIYARLSDKWNIITHITSRTCTKSCES